MAKVFPTIREHGCEVSICAGLIAYLIGLLCLTTFGSTIYTVCGYIGTILLCAGLLIKLGLIRTNLGVGSISIVTLIFTSVILFVTAANTIVTDSYLVYKITRFSGSHLNTKLCMDVIRPYSYLCVPLVEIGVIIFFIAMAIATLDNTIP